MDTQQPTRRLLDGVDLVNILSHINTYTPDLHQLPLGQRIFRRASVLQRVTESVFAHADPEPALAVRRHRFT